MEVVIFIAIMLVVLAGLTNSPPQTPPVVVMPQVQTGNGNRGVGLLLVILMVMVLLAEMAR